MDNGDTRADAELVTAIAAGDRDALALWPARAHDRARLTRRCNDASLIDEVVQDTFVAIWQGAKRYSLAP